MTREKRRALVKFVLLYVVSILLIVTIFSAYTVGVPKKQGDDNGELLRVNELLNNYLLQLNRLNEQYLTTLKFPITDNKRTLIQIVQKDLRDRINIKVDSINSARTKYDENTQIKYTAALANFKAAVQNWETVNTLILAAKGSDTTVTEKAGTQLRLQEEHIALLEDRLKASQSKVKSASARLLENQQEIHFLEWAVRSQVGTIKTLENKLKNR